MEGFVGVLDVEGGDGGCSREMEGELVELGLGFSQLRGERHEGKRELYLEGIVETEAYSTLEGFFGCCDRTSRAIDAVAIFVWKGDGFRRVLALSHSNMDVSLETNGGCAGDGELESHGRDIGGENRLGEYDRCQ